MKSRFVRSAVAIRPTEERRCLGGRVNGRPLGYETAPDDKPRSAPSSASRHILGTALRLRLKKLRREHQREDPAPLGTEDSVLVRPR